MPTAPLILAGSRTAAIRARPVHSRPTALATSMATAVRLVAPAASNVRPEAKALDRRPP